MEKVIKQKNVLTPPARFSKKKVISFDVGGTLIEVTPSVGEVYARVAKKFGLTVSAHVLNQRFRLSWRKLRHSTQNHNKAWWKKIVVDVFLPYTMADKENFFNELYQTFINPTVWHIFPDVVPVLQQLKRNGYTLVVASNWDNRLPQLLQRLELDQHFDHFFISYQLKRSKPSVEFFKTILHSLHIKPNQLFHIGDEMECDVLCPKEADIQSLLINRKQIKCAPYEINHLNQAIEAIDKHFHI